MPDKPILPTADELLTPALEKYYELRPNSFPHINLRGGVAWHPFLAQRGMLSLMLRRATSLIQANRLTGNTGTDLLDYVSSDYEPVPDPGRVPATGSVVFTRTDTMTSGDIPRGTRLVREPNLTTQIPLTSADYETLADVHFDIGQATSGIIPIQAKSPGKNANHPIRTDSVPHGVIVSNLFDDTISVSAFEAAGGCDGLDDPYVRQFATASATGQFGPTDDASIYGALRATGVRHVLPYDEGLGTQYVAIADVNWASSTRWTNAVQQTIYDDAGLVGFGCEVRVIPIRNKVIAAYPTVRLRDQSFLTETTDVDDAIRKAIRSYFDDRKDWNIWKTSALRAAVSRCHPKIAYCTAITIKDVAGVTVPQISSPNYATEQLHLYLANNAVTTTFLGPT